VRVLVLGGDGMLGHQLVRALRPRHQVRATLRGGAPGWPDAPLFPPEETYTGVDVRRPEAVLGALADFRPQAVVNAVGVVKQRAEGKDPLPNLQVNAVFPHQLAAMCQATGARLVHLSTDCVFSGRKGGYTEDDVPDAEDLYGRSKLLGELRQGGCLTLRTSMIGLEVTRKSSLVEWFLAQPGAVRGFTGAIFSGLTTLELARLIGRLLEQHPDLDGLWHVAAAPISKHDLLTQLAAALGRSEVRVEPSADFACDRSLDGSAFRRRTGYEAPSWSRMLEELAAAVRRRAAGERP
jgi:dTDP-4-dehydrorhamnose reductase